MKKPCMNCIKALGFLISGIWKPALGASLLFAICYGSMAAAQPTPRIVGGNAVPDNRYPFMAAIYAEANSEIDFYPSCAGSIIGSRWIMTAAHCVVNIITGEQVPASEVPVLIGARDLIDTSQGTLLVAQNIYVHPDYSIQTYASDIALIELPEDVSTPLMSLPAAGIDLSTVDERATLIGWGYIDEDFNSSTELQEVSLPIVPYARCLPFYSELPVQLQLDVNVCAGGAFSGGSRNGCRGDSGGPLFVERNGLWVQVGIASYGYACTNVPGVHTKVSSFTDWVSGFVPDLQISNAGPGTVDGPGMLDESTVVVLSADMPTGNGSLPQGELAYYEVTGATRVDLRLFSGDADLLIFTGTTFEASAIVCNSANFLTSLDSCDVPDTSQRVFAIVPMYEDTSYDITAVGFTTHTIRPTVSDNTISWADDGWYQVQRVTDEGVVEVCAGGLSCDVTTGNYIVINHTTGVRYENIIVSGEVSDSDVTVSGNTISWPDDGWYQVQRIKGEGIIEEVCAGGRSCDVAAGNYIVINHTTGVRFENITVSGEVPDSEVTVSGNTISWPDDGWYQVQRITDEGIIEVCTGGRSCDVTAGNYIVINHTTGQRYEPVIVEGNSAPPDSRHDNQSV